MSAFSLITAVIRGVSPSYKIGQSIVCICLHMLHTTFVLSIVALAASSTLTISILPLYTAI